MGIGKLGNMVYVINFSLTKEYIDPETHVYIVYYDKYKLGGTTRYTSINNYLGISMYETIYSRL
jgi:hypothetical protein